MIKVFPRAAVTCLLSLFLMPLFAADDAALEEMTRLLKMRLGTDAVETPVATGIEGVYQTRFGNKFAYLIEDGRYVFIGDLVDLKLARNMTEISRREMIAQALDEFGDEKMIVYPAEGEELAVLNVFTDTSCTYCQRLHAEIKYLQQAGIAVHYLPYPRGGSRGPGYGNMRKVWCADDQLLAMSIAKGTHTGRLEPEGDCAAAEFVDAGYALGNQIGVNGTPALYTADGASFNGYVPYQQLIPQLLEQ